MPARRAVAKHSAALLLCAFVCSVSASLRAQAPLATLRSEGLAASEGNVASDCPQVGALEAQVDAWLGRRAFGIGAALQFVVRFEPTHTGYRAVVDARRADGAPLGARALEDASCAALAQPVALVITLTIDPDAHPTLAAAPPRVAPPRVAPPRDAVAPASTGDATDRAVQTEAPPDAAIIADENTAQTEALIRAEPSAHADARLVLGVYGEGRAELGRLPGPAFGGAMGLTLAYGRLRLRVGGVLLGPRRTVDASARGADVAAFGGELGGCVALGLGRHFEGAGCAVFDAAAESATGFGFDRPRSALSADAGAALELMFRWRVSSAFALYVRAALRVALLRPRFVATGADGATREVFRADLLGGRLAIGASFDFL